MVELLIILLLILLNGVLAMAEIAMVSARKARLQNMAEMGDANAMAALELAVDPSDLLSATQIGITLVGVLAGAVGGASLAEGLAPWIARVEPLRPYSEALSLGLVVLTITFLSLILGELAPKRLALNNPERTATALAGPMRWLTRLTSPLVRFLTFSTDLVLNVIGVKPPGGPPVTEDEIRVLLEQATEAGVFEESEQDMVENVFRLADRRVESIMTPRLQVTWLDLDDPPEELRRTISESIFSRLPVARGDLDHVFGIVQAKDLLGPALEDGRLDLERALVYPQFVPESTPALQVLEMFRKSGVHIALVIDEFGGTQGLLTLQDIVEGIVGDLPGAGEPQAPQYLHREDGSWLLDGSLPSDELKELLELVSLPEETRGIYQTLGGLMMTLMGRIPAAGDHVDWSGLRFEVLDMDGFRVDKVLVQRLPPDQGTEWPGPEIPEE